MGGVVIKAARIGSLAGLVALLLMAWPTAVGAENGSGDLKVMSFNVRYSKDGAGEAKPENNWSDSAHPRRDRVIRMIRDYGPDIAGVQEARGPQIDDLRKALVDYDFYGVGRDDGKSLGEHSGIFYRRDRFRRLAEGSFWLSATPEKPGTTFHTRPNAVPRIASWVRLVDNSSGREFLVLNMHWDHESEPARRKSAALVRERLAGLAEGRPIIVMGDFNSPEQSPALKVMLGGEGDDHPRLVDSYRHVHPDREVTEATFNNWTGTTKGSRIDFILTSPGLGATSAEIVRTAYDGFWPSDHYPVTATLRWQAAQ